MWSPPFPSGLTPALDRWRSSASEFIKSGDVYLEKDAAGRVRHIPVTGKGSATGIPMVVLINAGSASGSETRSSARRKSRRRFRNSAHAWSHC